ncbi:MAG: Holliday junction resolvase RuvX [bacterium]
MNKPVSENLNGKRIIAIDYGLKRVGLAVCDELHISITPLRVLFPDSSGFWDELLTIIQYERAFTIVVGIPQRLDNEKTDVILKIEEFIGILKEKTSLEIMTFDESFSTHRAVETMISIGKRKKNRAKKGSKDIIAAAIILRDFLSELE